MASEVQARCKRGCAPIILLFLIFTHTLYITQAYSIMYFDYNSINKLATYQLSEVCKPLKVASEIGTNTINNTIQLNVLQKWTTKRMKGYSCQIVSSKFTDYCGAYGYLKWARLPEISVTHTISPSSCAQIISTLKFTADDGSLHPVQLQTETVLHTTELGSIEVEDNSVTCRGQPLNMDAMWSMI